MENNGSVSSKPTVKTFRPISKNEQTDHMLTQKTSKNYVFLSFSKLLMILLRKNPKLCLRVSLNHSKKIN